MNRLQPRLTKTLIVIACLALDLQDVLRSLATA